MISIKKDVLKDKTVLYELKKHYHGKCAYCGTKTDNLEIEHYHPNNKKLDWCNLLFICEACNYKIPYEIKQFKILNYQGIKKIHIRNIPTNTQWIFLTGENGYGKTSILQAIVIGLYGNEDNGQILDKNKGIKGVVEFKNNNENQINLHQTEISNKFKNFATYGASRLNKNSKPVNNSKTFSLFNSYSELLDIEQKLIEWEKDDKQKKYFNSTKKILEELLNPQVSKIRIDRDGSKNTVVYHEINSKKNDWKKFEELASGYRSIVAMIGDVIIRLQEEQPNITDYKELAGIVFIDEFDLHLHPKWQKMLVEKLTKIFPKVQFIVSTHSPIPFLGAPKNSVIIKVNRTKEDGITAEKLDIDVSTLTPNSILTSPIFGFREIISSENKDLSKLRTEDDYDEILFNKEVEKRINSFMDKTKNL